mgnify:CR=1 FL=1
MSATSTLSTVIDSQVKKVALIFCKKHGLKLRHFIESALVERLEDEIDVQAYFERRDEDTIPLEKILAGRNKG